jgi:general secretion pathway protein D
VIVAGVKVRNHKVVRLSILLLAIALTVGCAATRAFRQAEQAGAREDWDKAVLGYSKALALDPGNTRYSVSLARAKLRASAQHFNKGQRYMAAHQWDLAVTEFQQTLLLNPGNEHANNEMEKALREIARRDQGPSMMEQIKAEARRRELAPPKLDPRANIPIVMMFRDRPIGEVFEAISKASGINFLYDDKVDTKKPITIDIGNVTMEKALDILMLQTKNFYKVIDEHTILIAPDQRQKRQEYEDQVIRTFYLSNGDTKQVVTLLRTLLNSRQIAENPELNSVTIKDTPDKVAIGEKIIAANDKSRGEIVIDVEILEIDRAVARNAGLDLSSKTLTLQFRDGEQFIPLNNLDVLTQSGNWLLGPIPSVVLSFLKSDSHARLIAKPQLRVSEGEKAEVLIGDRVPIPTTSFNTSQTVGGNIVPITSFTYQNVGVTVQLEPRVHHNKEVTLKVLVEISQVTSTVETVSGQAQPIIGTRNVQTVLRLRDGETNLLAGLIRREDKDTLSGVIGLTDIPGMNRVFGNTDKSMQELDIVMTLTPHIIRIPDITEDDLATLWVGTEENMKLRGPTRNALNVSPFATRAEETAEGPAPSGGGVAAIAGGPEPETEAPGAGTTGPGVETPTGEPGAEGAPGAAGAGAAAGADTRTEPGADEVPEDREVPTPTGPTVVRVVPSAASHAVGDRVVLQVMISNARNVGSVPFHLRYNRQDLEFIPPGTEGSFLRSDGSGTVFLASDSAGGGEVVVGLSRMGGGEGVSGSGVLATFEFQAINPGDCGFAFSGASVKDPRAQNLPASFVPATVRVE